jgi:predicted metal-dependent peptidase
LTDKIMTQPKSQEEYEKFLSEIKNKISVARYQMVTETPFFGIISSHLKIIPVSERLKGRIKTAAVTPTGICMYNPNFVGDISFKETKGLLAHEALHPALNFWERFLLQDLKIANKAHDYAINVPIVDSPDMDLPKGGLYEKEYRNMSAEEIFFLLEKEENAKKEQGEGQGKEQGEGQGQGQGKEQGEGQGQGQGEEQGEGQGQGQGEEQGEGQGGEQGENYTLEGDVDEDIIKEIEKEYYREARGREITDDELSQEHKNAKQQWSDALQQAFIADKADGQGSLPQWMVAEIEGILFPKMDFRKLVRRFFGQFGHPSRPSFKHRNKRNTYQANTFLKPKLIKNLPKLYLLLDTSGSMWDEEGSKMVQGALGIIKRLANNDQYEIVIVMADTEVKEELSFTDVMKAVKEQKIKSIGGGGSDFRSAFEHIWQSAKIDNLGQSPILCITDGAITVPETTSRNRTATAWITPPNVSPPTTKWGEHMEMDI